MEFKNEVTLTAFVLSKATLEKKFEVPDPAPEGTVKFKTREEMTDADLDDYVVALLSSPGNTDVISEDSVIFGGLKIDTAVAWKQLVYLCLALGMTTLSILTEVKKRHVYRIEYFTGFVPQAAGFTPELKCLNDALAGIYGFLHACGYNALPDGTDLGLVLKAIRVDRSIRLHPMKFKVDYEAMEKFDGTFINFQDWVFGVKATLCQIGLIDIIENEQYAILNRAGDQMVGSLLYNVLRTDTAVFAYHQTELSNGDRGFSGYHIFKALMDHLGSAKLMIACRAQYVKRTKTLIFDRDLPEEEAIQTADHYLENFKVLYCKIKRCEKALNALPATERETWTAAKCVSDESHRIALLEGIRDLKYQSKVSHLEEARKDIHIIMKEVINLHIAECIKLNENVVWGASDLEPEYANVFKTRVAFNAK
jgi:hypothetical protein